MEIREYRQYDEREILPLYASVGWTAYTDQPVFFGLWGTGRRSFLCRTY